MAKSFNNVPVDKTKFLRELHKRNLSMVDMSVEMGRAHNYITESLRHGRFTGVTVSALKSMYNITPDMYTTDTAQEAPVKPEAPAALDYDKLYNVIFHAVYNATKKAWSE